MKSLDKIGLFDGAGNEYDAQIIKITPNKVEIKILNKFTSFEQESKVNIIVAQAYLKDKKNDILVRQLSELGINSFLPFYSARSVPMPDSKRLKNRLQRWEKIAKEALKQCKRNKFLEVN